MELLRGAVTEKNVRDAADAFVKVGLRDHGWTFINIDDFWMPKNGDNDRTLHGPERDASGKINANPRFPDMNALTDYIHSLGLKAGIYSSPVPRRAAAASLATSTKRKTRAAWLNGALTISSMTGAAMARSRREAVAPLLQEAL